MSEKRETISGYKLSPKANNFCIVVFFLCAVIYGLALFGLDYPPLTKFFGSFAFVVAVAISSPKFRIWVRKEQNWEYGKCTSRSMSNESESTEK
ncbi:hypothetical protein M3899_003127 [Vibrio parahaemolyticus]|nr:hypothetical protein [Vibrio parahaemolyticus]